MVYFRKANNVSDLTLRCFTVTEVYLRRAKENLRKKKNVECTRNLDLETLIARDSWATIEEMEQEIPFLMNRYRNIIQNCLAEGIVTKGDLVFYYYYYYYYYLRIFIQDCHVKNWNIYTIYIFINFCCSMGPGLIKI